MPLPNFFVAGFPKAGTTSLYHYLDQHPAIYVSPIKEPGFFAAADFAAHPFRDALLRGMEADRPLLRKYLDGPMREKRGHGLVFEWEDYLKLFRNVRNETAIGEASVVYSYFPGAASAIAARVPAARVIMILRDPAERMFSQYLASLEANSRRSFREYFEASLDSRRMESGWLQIGRYATHVRRFFDLFSRDRVRIYLYEDTLADPRGILRDVFGFLGVDPDYPVDVTRRYNQPRVPRFPRLDSAVRRVRRKGIMGRLLPESVSRAARSLYYRGRAELRMSESDRRLVVERHREEIEKLQALIGRDLAAWLR